MARPTVDLDVQLQVTFEEISEDEVAGWRAGISLLLQWIREAKYLSEESNGLASDDIDSDCGSFALDGHAFVADRVLQEVDA